LYYDARIHDRQVHLAPRVGKICFLLQHRKIRSTGDILYHSFEEEPTLYREESNTSKKRQYSHNVTFWRVRVAIVATKTRQCFPLV